MDEITRGKVEAYAPSLLLYEVAFIPLKAMSAHILKSSDGLAALMAMGHPGDRDRRDEMGDLPEIFEIAAATKFTTYDSAYIYVSKRAGAKLVTVDSGLKQKGGKVVEVILLRDLV